MAKLNISLLLLLISFLYMLNISHSANATNPEAEYFIKSECQATRYRALCIQCLSNYSTKIQKSQQMLAHTALSVSLARAQSTSTFVSRLARMKGMKPTEYQAVKDCIQNMGDTVDQLRRSMKELGLMSRVASGDFEWHVSNVKTWVSGALTSENTCQDGFARSTMNGHVKVAIRTRVLDCAQVTSIALALVNRFAETARDKVGSNVNNLP